MTLSSLKKWIINESLYLFPDHRVHIKECRAQQRANLLDDFCKASYPAGQKSTSPKNFYVGGHMFFYADKRNKIMLCAVPKSGISSWKNLLMQISSNNPNISSNPHIISTVLESGLHIVPTEKTLSEEYNDYYKFIVVRHPLARVVSAYKDIIYEVKVEVPDHNCGGEMLARYRDCSNLTLEQCAKLPPYPTWQEFASHVAARDVKCLNRHWMTVEKLCQPCRIRYDGIMKLETVDHDAETFLDMYRGTNNFHIRHLNEKKDIKSVEDYINELPKAVVAKLIDKYKVDMAMLGYKFENNKRNCMYTHQNSRCTC